MRFISEGAGKRRIFVAREPSWKPVEYFCRSIAPSKSRSQATGNTCMRYGRQYERAGLDSGLMLVRAGCILG
jgi:hypothetical protein